MDRQLDRNALDRYITGNYGEDRYRGMVECQVCGELYDPDDSQECPNCTENTEEDE